MMRLMASECVDEIINFFDTEGIKIQMKMKKDKYGVDRRVLSIFEGLDAIAIQLHDACYKPRFSKVDDKWTFLVLYRQLIGRLLP